MHHWLPWSFCIGSALDIVYVQGTGSRFVGHHTALRWVHLSATPFDENDLVRPGQNKRLVFPSQKLKFTIATSIQLIVAIATYVVVVGVDGGL